MTRNGGSHRWRQVRRRALKDATTCWLCGEPIDRTLGRYDPMSLSADHEIPVAVAPELEFDPANIKPAHLVCNQRRGTGSASGRGVPSSYDW